MCASVAATRFSGAAGSATMAGEGGDQEGAVAAGLQALPPLFPQFCLLYVFQSTHLQR